MRGLEGALSALSFQLILMCSSCWYVLTFGTHVHHECKSSRYIHTRTHAYIIKDYNYTHKQFISAHIHSEGGFFPFESNTVCTSTLPGGHADDLCALLLQNAPGSTNNVDAQQHHTLVGEARKRSIPENGLLGSLPIHQSPSISLNVYLNTHDPFCFVTLGVQGSGKSHSLAVVVENCVLRVNDECTTEQIMRLQKPMSSLVFHYDQNQFNLCEIIDIVDPSDQLCSFFADLGHGVPTLPRNKMLVVVSPTNYHQRKAFYGPDVQVVPLLFTWDQLSAQQIKCLMRLNDGDNQLYVSTMLSLMRSFQRNQTMPPFQEFLTQIHETCSVRGQSGPLGQQLKLLEGFMKESKDNKEFHNLNIGGDLLSLLQDGMMVVADLTDPYLSPEEANGIFQVLLDQFRSHIVCGNSGGGKLLILDEVHRYISGSDSDGLSKSIVDTVRLIRHEGLRVAISTQSPKVLAPELLELVSIMMIHRFQSEEWYTYLKSKVPLPPDGFDAVHKLHTGQALVFAAKQELEGHSDHDFRQHSLLVSVRRRFTQDLGASVTNSICLRNKSVQVQLPLG